MAGRLRRTGARGGGRPVGAAVVALAVLVVLVALASVVVVIGRGRDRGPERKDDPATVAPGAVPPADVEPPLPGTDLDDTDAAFAAVARSVATDGTLTVTGAVHLTGRFQLSVSGQLSDATGPLGEGTLAATSAVAVEGATAVRGPVVIRPGDVVLRAGEVETISRNGVVAGDDDVTLVGRKLRVIGEGRMSIVLRNGQSRGVRGAVEVTLDEDEAAVVEGEDVRWESPSGIVEVAWSGERRSLSWAGAGGRVRWGDGATRTAEHGGVLAVEAAATVRRQSDSVALEGTATVRQVYLDGLPQMRTSAKVDVVRTLGKVRRGERGLITWAPRNTGDRVDMVITRVRPGNDAGAWVNVALDPLPAMSGGEDRPPAGGDTGSLGDGADGITAVIQPGTADRRDLTFDVPADADLGEHTIELVVEGGFDPITVKVPVEVLP